jgi:hypothetical protein
MTRFAGTLFDFARSTRNGRRKAPEGISTSDLILSAYLGTNADVFERIVQLHVPRGARVADVTFGQGVFWRNIPPKNYKLVPSDIQSGVDCRSLPYPDGSFNCAVLDPPYMEGLFRKSTNDKLTISRCVAGEVRSS